MAQPPDAGRAADDFAARLRRLMRRRGVTRYRLAQLTGLSREGVSKLEGGRSDPRLSTLLRVAAALGVPPRALLPGDGEGGAAAAPAPRRRKKSG
jgi:transcriptional regulator with XRE-family HTH domain